MQELANLSPGGFDISGLGLSHHVLELGEDLLDGIEVGAVGRQEEQPCSSLPDDPANLLAFVAAVVIGHVNVAGPQRLEELRLHVSFEGLAIDRTVEDPWCIDAVMAQRCDEGHGLPVTMRHAADQALAAWGAAMGAGHVRLGPGLINEDEAGRVDPPLVPPPALTLGDDVRPALLGGVQAFF
jgi:hypothetical protein